MMRHCSFDSIVRRSLISILNGTIFGALLLFGSQVVRAATLVVPPGGDLQAAINAAQAGDTIIVEGGAVYLGPFTLPVKSGADYITIQSSRAGELAEGVRVTPSQSALFAKLQSAANGEPVVKTEAGAHHYKFVGIQFSTRDSEVVVYDLIRFGESQAQTTLESVPHHLVIDRCYIHGFTTQDVQRGISLNSAETSVLNSYISDIHGRGYDTQAIAGWNGPGPYRIVNNYLEAAGENLMFGGADPSIPNLVPSDIQIRRNHFFKPLSWKKGDPSFVPLTPPPGAPWLDHWTVKNSFELKAARRVVIDGNVFENCWLDAQVGFAILIKSANQDGGCPLCVTEDVTFSNNTIKNADHGLNLVARDFNAADPPGAPVTNNLRFVNNLWIDIPGMWYQNGGAQNVTVAHNTHVTPSATGNTAALYGTPSSNFVMRDNLGVKTGYGIFGDATGEGRVALERFAPAFIYAGNVLVGGSTPAYPEGNFYPATLGEVQLLTDFRLAESSPFKRRATDGTDPGVDMNALLAAQTGSTPGPTPTPTPTPSPSPTPTPGQLGQIVIRAKRDGQDLSNQISGYGGGSQSPGSGNQLMDSNSIEAITRFVDQIQEAQVQFNAERDIYPAAVRIELALSSALNSALAAQSAVQGGDLTSVRNHLRQAIDQLELSTALISHGNISNAIDVTTYIVRQHYVDFLDREPDQNGNDFWINQIDGCGSDGQCLEAQRINVSASFFLSIEFQNTGYFVYRLYKSSYARMPLRAEFLPDSLAVSHGVIVGTPGWEARLAAAKQALLDNWVQRPEFNTCYGAFTNEQYVDALVANLGVTISSTERDSLVMDLANGASRASVLGRLVENQSFAAAEFNRAFVLMQYFGYLRRDPDGPGFNFWLNKLNQFGGNYIEAEMVKAFLSSMEYRARFSL